MFQSVLMFRSFIWVWECQILHLVFFPRVLSNPRPFGLARGENLCRSSTMKRLSTYIQHFGVKAVQKFISRWFFFQSKNLVQFVRIQVLVFVWFKISWWAFKFNFKFEVSLIQSILSLIRLSDSFSLLLSVKFRINLF